MAVGVTFEHPAFLLLLLLSPLAAWAGVRYFSSMSRIRRWSAVVMRVILISLITAMLAGASSVRRTDRMAVIGIIDVSASVRLFGQGGVDSAGKPRTATEAARSFLIKAQKQRGPDDLLGMVAFDGRALAIATPTRGDIEARSVDVSGAEGSDIAAAIRYAAALIPPDTAGRLVLFTDGDQTSGDAIAAAKEVSGRSGSGVPLDVVPIELDATQEVMVESVDTPPRAAPESTITARVSLFSTAKTAGTLQLIHEGDLLDINGTSPGTGRRLELEPGRHIELITTTLPTGSLHRFRAIFEPDHDAQGRLIGDSRVENNSADSLTVTSGRGSVLLVDGVNVQGGPGNGGILAQTLRESGIEVAVIPSEAIPDNLMALQAYGLVILENVPAESVTPAAQAALVEHVRDMGAGLVMVGGRDSLGAGGWKGSVLEPILPVKLDLPEKLVQPDAAVIFVMDNSGSMQRPVMASIYSQQEIANQSAALAVRTLSKKDLIGVIVFNSDYTELVPLSPNADPKSTGEKILSISPGGGTNMGPALEKAGQEMAKVKASVKHIIVLSDGRSMGYETLPELAEKIRTQSGAMITTISVGDEADEPSMADIAVRGGGKSYVVNNPNFLPKVFLKAIRVVRTPLVSERAFEPVLLPVPSPLTTGLGTPPRLLGLVLTQRRPEPTITYSMAAPTGEPLLAHWNVELGKVAVFTSDASTWAKDWLTWPGYRQMWLQIAKTITRVDSDGPYQLTAGVSGEWLNLRMDAAGGDGAPVDGLTVPAKVYMPGKIVSVTLSQTAPGIYEGRVPARQTGAYTAVVKPPLHGTQQAALIAGTFVSSGIEFRRLTTDHALLEQIAKESRGRVLNLNTPDAAKLFDRAGVLPREARTPLWRPLLLWTLIVLLLDVGTRRIAWDRFVSREYGVDLRRAARESVQDRGAKAAKVVTKLREAPKRVKAGPVATLTDEDARRVAEAESERRRNARLDAVRATRERQEAAAAEASNLPRAFRTNEPTSQPSPTAHGNSESPSAPLSPTNDPKPEGLLAAKRRARERMEGE